MPRHYAIAVFVAFLVACTAQAPVEAPLQPPPAAPVVAEVPERPFPNDSLYALLVAEFALRRGAYDIALEQYRAQSPELRDVGVSAHTTQISQFLHRDQDTLQAAQLWVELAPGDMNARNSLATQLVSSGRGAEALPHLAEIERQGHGANFPIVLSNLERLTPTERDALAEDLDALSDEFPDNGSLLFAQALLQYEMSQPELALQTLAALFELEPAQPQALLLEGRIRNTLGDPRPYARIESVLADDPDNRALRLRYARLLTGSDMPAARRQFEILSKQAPDDADLLYSLALISRETGDSEAARAYLRQLLELGERQNAARYYLGRIAEDADDIDSALDHYQAVRPGDEYLAAVNRIGLIFISSGQLDRASAWFQTQRENYPTQRESLFGMQAELLDTAGYTREALTLLDSALQSTPEATALLYSRAMISERRDDLDAMEADLRTILAQDADNATALNALGYTLANRTQRLDEALQLITRALALEPDEPAILDSMGWVLFRLGRLAEALQYLTRAYAEFPDPEVAAHLGEVLWASGDRQRARDIWREAAMLDPNHPILRSTLERLQVTLPEVPPPESTRDAGS